MTVQERDELAALESAPSVAAAEAQAGSGAEPTEPRWRYGRALWERERWLDRIAGYFVAAMLLAMLILAFHVTRPGNSRPAAGDPQRASALVGRSQIAVRLFSSVATRP